MPFWSSRKETDVSALEKRLSDLALDVAVLRRELMNTTEGLNDLRDKHISLRGKVYAAKLHKAGAETEGPKELSREDLRRSLAASGRFVPGRPAVHNE